MGASKIIIFIEIAKAEYLKSKFNKIHCKLGRGADFNMIIMQ